MSKMFANQIRCALLLVLAIAALSANTADGPSMDQPYAGDRNVTGTDPGATSLTVYEVTADGKRYLGNGSSIDKDGVFAVAVNPPLNLGQQILVVDSQGRASSAVTVVSKTGPVTGPK